METLNQCRFLLKERVKNPLYEGDALSGRSGPHLADLPAEEPACPAARGTRVSRYYGTSGDTTPVVQITHTRRHLRQKALIRSTLLVVRPGWLHCRCIAGGASRLLRFATVRSPFPDAQWLNKAGRPPAAVPAGHSATRRIATDRRPRLQVDHDQRRGFFQAFLWVENRAGFEEVMWAAQDTQESGLRRLWRGLVSFVAGEASLRVTGCVCGGG